MSRRRQERDDEEYRREQREQQAAPDHRTRSGDPRSLYWVFHETDR